MFKQARSMQVVILCGGKGTRSYPFTDYFPKALMPIGGSPIVVHLMQIFANHGVTDFVLAAGHRQEMLEDYFAGKYDEWNVQVVDTGENSDTGDRILRCAPYLGPTFMATYGDGLGNINVDRLLAFHKERGGLATVTSVPLRSQYGTVSFADSQKVQLFREKPIIADHWINAGFFVFEKEAFQFWEGSTLERETLPALAARGLLYAYRHEGFWKSMDTSKDQDQMQEIYGSGNPPWFREDLTRQAPLAPQDATRTMSAFTDLHADEHRSVRSDDPCVPAWRGAPAGFERGPAAPRA